MNLPHKSQRGTRKKGIGPEPRSPGGLTCRSRTGSPQGRADRHRHPSRCETGPRERQMLTDGPPKVEGLITMNIELLTVQVWDTAGQERFRKSMVEHYYRNVHAVVFVYDVTKMTSFINLKTWIEECNGHAVPALVPRVLVGNKCDLKDLIQVPSSMALKFADAHNMLLFETSAKDPKESQNVDAIFMCLACRLKAQRSLLCRDLEGRPGPARRLEPPHDAVGKASCPC
ncbi:ras-related protein Rab-33A isoform X1 [Colius striatus]|uniref:ras-related protein Rab-33A isoform X1 n=1 Tax=Colius striatus TaxID=57412 RepID=UPI002B1D9FFF|nr:ras-related protein Rab-33A isoform X1 [Colius striatus]